MEESAGKVAFYQEVGWYGAGEWREGKGVCKQIQHETVGDTAFSLGFVGRGLLWSHAEAHSEEVGCGESLLPQ